MPSFSGINATVTVSSTGDTVRPPPIVLLGAVVEPNGPVPKGFWCAGSPNPPSPAGTPSREPQAFVLSATEGGADAWILPVVKADVVLRDVSCGLVLNKLVRAWLPFVLDGSGP